MKNNLFSGILLGVIFPLVAFLLDRYTALSASFLPDKPIAIYVIAAVINLVAVRFIYRSGREDTAKGIVLITFVAMAVMIFVLKIKV